MDDQSERPWENNVWMVMLTMLPPDRELDATAYSRPPSSSPSARTSLATAGSATTRLSSSSGGRQDSPREKCEIIEITKHADSYTTCEERTIPAKSVLEWMRDGSAYDNSGRSAIAYTKILIVPDPFYKELEFILDEESLKGVFEAAQIDPRLRDALLLDQHGSYMTEYFPKGSNSSYLCFYGSLGNHSERAAWSYDRTRNRTQAIFIGYSRGLREAIVGALDSFEHPLFLSLCFRKVLRRKSSQSYSESERFITSIETSIGYLAFFGDGDAPKNLDLAEGSKGVGIQMSRLGLLQTIVSLTVSARQCMGNNGGYGWTELVPDNERETYRKLCEVLLGEDDIVER